MPSLPHKCPVLCHSKELHDGRWHMPMPMSLLRWSLLPEVVLFPFDACVLLSSLPTGRHRILFLSIVVYDSKACRLLLTQHFLF